MNNLYLKLARTNLVKNKLLYVPYILAGIACTAFVYIMSFIAQNDGLSSVRGAETLQSTLLIGVWVTLIVAYIFIFYANSFLIKRRKKEFGVYNMLGMEKRHIARVLALETLFAGIIAIVGGLLCGILFSKFLLMLAYKILAVPQVIGFEVNAFGLVATAIAFAILFILILLINVIQVLATKTVDLLSGGNVGEKEPKTKVVMTILGLGLLVGAYYISFTTENPVKVIGLFFIAVLMVIAGTYALFTAGSIALLKGLRKNKKYYYKKNHFAAVAGMIYRMKQNAAGLASICILSTMVLVMLSTTVSLYAGIEGSVNAQYPTDIVTELRYETAEMGTAGLVEEMDQCVEKLAAGTYEKHVGQHANAYTINDGMNFDISPTFEIGISAVYVFTREDFLDTIGYFEHTTVPEIPKGEAYLLRNSKYEYDKINLAGNEITLSGSSVYESRYNQNMASSFTSVNFVIVSDREDFVKLCKNVDMMYYTNVYYNVEGDEDFKQEVARQISTVADSHSKTAKKEKMVAGITETRSDGEKDAYALNGSFLFLGVFLGMVFLLITVLIIFFKQISEGYDDKHRFEIMKKVGMSNKEVKATIRSQVRIVFFLPLVTAGIHVFAAFPMIRRILFLFNLTDDALFVRCLLATIGVFAVIYYIVFKITSQEYYKIVGNEAK